jgi:hypothetical protein
VLRRSPWFLATVLLSACSFSDAVDPQANIRCRDASDCPSGWRCEQAFCRLGAVDSRYTVSQVSVTPRHGALGTVFSASFTIEGSFDLTAEPTVFTDRGVTFSLVPGQSAPPSTWVFSFQADAQTPEGDHTVSVQLPDRAEPRTEVLGTVGVDVTPPQVTAVLTYEKPPGCPLSAVSALGPVGGQVRIRLSASEPMNGLTLRAEPAGKLALVVVGGDAGVSEEQLGVLVDSTANQDIALYVDGQDLAGNPTASTPVAQVHVDTAAPAAAATDVPGLFVLQRTPWGALDGTAPSTAVAVAAGAVSEPLEAFVSYAGPGNLPGQASLSPGSATRLDLLKDGVDLTVVLYDEACNASPPARVRDVRLVATSFDGGLANPLVVESRQVLAEGRALRESGGAVRVDGLTSRQGDALSVALSAGVSFRLRRPELEVRSSGGLLTYDPDHGRVREVWARPDGGTETIEWDGFSWSGDPINGLTSLPATDTTQAAVTYDQRQQAMVLVVSDGGTLDTYQHQWFPSPILGRSEPGRRQNESRIGGD